MELLWWSHLVALLCISSLMSVNYTWFTRSLRDSECEASICESVITLERERRWQDISFGNVAGCPSIIPCRIGVSHFCHYSYQGRPLPGVLQESAWVSWCDLYKKKVHDHPIRFRSYFAFVQVGLTIPACQKSVDTDGLYSPRALYECYKASRIQWLCQHRVMNRVHKG